MKGLRLGWVEHGGAFTTPGNPELPNFWHDQYKIGDELYSHRTKKYYIRIDGRKNKDSKGCPIYWKETTLTKINRGSSGKYES